MNESDYHRSSTGLFLQGLVILTVQDGYNIPKLLLIVFLWFMIRPCSRRIDS